MAQGSSSIDCVNHSKPGEAQADRIRRCYWKSLYCRCPGSKLEMITDSSIFCTLFWLWPSTPPGGGFTLEQGPLDNYQMKIRSLIITHYQPCLFVGLTSVACLFLSYVHCDMLSHREWQLLVVGRTFFFSTAPGKRKRKSFRYRGSGTNVHICRPSVVKEVGTC